MKRKSDIKKHWLLNYTLMVIGAFIVATGFVLFITPYKIVPGGVYGLSIIIHYITKGVFSFAPQGLPIGTMGLLLDIPITLIGIRILGRSFGVRNLFGLILTSIFKVFFCCLEQLLFFNYQRPDFIVNFLHAVVNVHDPLWLLRLPASVDSGGESL